MHNYSCQWGENEQMEEIISQAQGRHGTPKIPRFTCKLNKRKTSMWTLVTHGKNVQITQRVCDIDHIHWVTVSYMLALMIWFLKH